MTTSPEQLSVAVGKTHDAMALHKPTLLFSTISDGHEANTGAWLSITVTVKLHVVTFPLASVAVNVLVVMPIGNADPEGNPAVCVTTSPIQLSVATGATHDTFAKHDPGVLLTLMLAGHELNTGNWLSVTVTVKEQILVLPLASTALYEILVVPMGKDEPEDNPAV